MYARILCCALCLSASPCLAGPIVYEHGPLPPLIEEHSIIVAGEYARSLESMALLEISGGQFSGSSSPGSRFGLKRLTAPTFIIHARYARAQLVRNKPVEPGYSVIQGWLDDGSFFRFNTVNEYDAPGLDILHITPTNEPLPFMPDADGDTDLDIEDLNAVRNNFGGTGDGDIDDSGLVDIDDLNFVRNNFGYVQFTLDESFESPVGWSLAGLPGVPIPGGIPVPEPSSLTLLAVAAGVVASRRRRR